MILCIYNKQWENCAADYAAGKLGKEVGGEAGCSMRVECFPNKLVILKE